MLTNHDTKLIRELYQDFLIEEIEVRRAINSDPEKRKGKEVIIRNYGKRIRKKPEQLKEKIRSAGSGEEETVMSTEVRLMIKNLQKLEHFYVLISKATNLPFAECDAETFDDQVAVFENEEDASEYAKKLEGQGYPTVVTDMVKEKMSAFYTGLYLTGINRLAFHNGVDFCYLDLEKVVTLKKPEQKRIYRR